MRTAAPALLVALAVLAGCTTPRDPGPNSPMTTANADGPVVIAFIDSGVNPYYDIFSSSVGRVPNIAPDATLKLSTSGTRDERLDADAAVWESIEMGKLYHIDGTRLYAITFTDRDPRMIVDSSAHGSAVTYIGAAAAPDVVIVAVHVWVGPCATLQYCLWDPSIADAIEWVAAQPWIDVISTAMGYPGNPPQPSAASETVMRWRAAAEEAARAGKIILGAAGNDPSTSLGATFTGPPWAIAVGGFQPEQSGEQLDSSKLIDVVGNYSQYIPSTQLDGEYAWYHGTSFAAPEVAGTIAQAWHLVEHADPTRKVTTRELRDALNATAQYVSAAAWDPEIPSPADPFGAFRSSLPILTQAQMGWGYVNSSLAPEIARRVLEGDLAPPPEKDQAIVIQAQYQRAREEYWANWPR